MFDDLVQVAVKSVPIVKVWAQKNTDEVSSWPHVEFEFRPHQWIYQISQKSDVLGFYIDAKPGAFEHSIGSSYKVWVIVPPMQIIGLSESALIAVKGDE